MVIECGQADAEEIADLSGDGTVVVVSTLHRSEEATQMGTGLEAAGQREVILRSSSSAEPVASGGLPLGDRSEQPDPDRAGFSRLRSLRAGRRRGAAAAGRGP